MPPLFRASGEQLGPWDTLRQLSEESPRHKTTPTNLLPILIYPLNPLAYPQCAPSLPWNTLYDGIFCRSHAELMASALHLAYGPLVLFTRWALRLPFIPCTLIEPAQRNHKAILNLPLHIQLKPVPRKMIGCTR